jgi:peptide/nickel transport system permease protein
MRSALARFARNRLALLGAAVLLGLLALVALTPLLFPDDPFRLVGPALQPPGGMSPRRSPTARAPR